MFDQFKKESVFQYARISNSEDVYGDSIKNSKQAFGVYNVVCDQNHPIGTERGKYHFISGYGIYDSQDCIQS